MKDNLDKLKGHSDTKHDITRRNGNGLVGKEAIKLNKRINDIAKVISDPDVWNVNIASREKIERLEERVEELERKLAAILSVHIQNPPE
tara:strand:+ start:93 stop:359 length:267 start_codon:yes stop_codon:yes gene_type:complete